MRQSPTCLGPILPLPLDLDATEIRPANCILDSSITECLPKSRFLRICWWGEGLNPSLVHDTHSLGVLIASIRESNPIT